MRFKAILLLCFLLSPLQEHAQPRGKGPALQPSATPVVTPTPAISVSFGRQSLREGDSVQVEIWLSNNSDQDLQNPALEIAAPKFMHWHRISCEQPEFGNDLLIGPIAAHKTLSFPLCVYTDNEIEVGDFNILFTLTYEWDGNAKKSFVSSEKAIKVNLFGSDSLAGVPLGLAGFIVPGLFFWIFAHFWRVPWNKELGSELIYSVLISVILIACGYLLRQFLTFKWLTYFDIRSGISVAKLSALAAAGIVFGNLFGVLYFWWQQRKLAQIITAKDDLIVAVEKVVKQNPGYIYPTTTITDENSHQFVGSLSATSDNTTWLIGWFRIDIKPHTSDTKFIKKIKHCYERRDDLGVLHLIRKKNIKLRSNKAKEIQLEETDLITEKFENTETPREKLMSWKDDEILGEPLKKEKNAGLRLLDINL